MLSLVSVSPVITAFHSCCLSHHVFVTKYTSSVPGEHCQKIAVSNPTQVGQRYTWSQKRGAILGIRLQDSAFLSEVAVKSPEEGQREFSRNVVKEETTQKTTKMRGKSPQKINKN